MHRPTSNPADRRRVGARWFPLAAALLALAWGRPARSAPAPAGAPRGAGDAHALPTPHGPDSTRVPRPGHGAAHGLPGVVAPGGVTQRQAGGGRYLSEPGSALLVRPATGRGRGGASLAVGDLYSVAIAPTPTIAPARPAGLAPMRLDLPSIRFVPGNDFPFLESDGTVLRESFVPIATLPPPMLPRLEPRRLRETTLGSFSLAAQLTSLGIYARDKTLDETLDSLIGRSFYDDLPAVPNPGPQDYKIASARIAFDEAIKAIADYRALRYQPKLDDRGRPIRDARGRPVEEDRFPRLKSALSRTWQAYADKAGEHATGSGYRAWLAQQPASDENAASARLTLSRLHALRAEVHRLTLGEVYQVNAEQTMVQDLKPSGMGRDQFKQAIESAGL